MISNLGLIYYLFLSLHLVGEGIYSCWVGDIWGGRCDCWVGVPFFGRLGLGGMTTYTKVHYQAIVIED